MNIEDFAKQILETEFGYSATKITEGDTKSPDFLVDGNGEKFLVELKTRLDDAETQNLIKKYLSLGEIAEFSDTTGRKNRLSRIICDAGDQLASLDIDVDYKLVWLMAVGENQEMKKQQFKSTLYGISTIFDLDSPHTFPCYYFQFSDFYRTKDIIDGAIISTLSKAEFCLNTYSGRYLKLKQSFLAKKFDKACCDPFDEEKDERAMIVDSDVDRRDKSKVLKYLNNKYKRYKLQDMNMGFHSAKISVPTDGTA